MMTQSSVAPPNLQAKQKSTSQNLGLVSPLYLVRVIRGRNRIGSCVLQIVLLKTRGLGGSGDALRSSALS
jgi:hypothetical protein